MARLELTRPGWRSVAPLNLWQVANRSWPARSFRGHSPVALKDCEELPSGEPRWFEPRFFNLRNSMSPPVALKNGLYEPHPQGLLGFDIPVEGGTFENLLHGDVRAADEIFEAFVLYGDGRLNFVKRGLHGGDTCRERAVDLQSLIEFALVYHQPRAARQVAIVAREERHERRSGRVDRRLAQKDEAAV
jgi:hypothetical protein